MHPLHMHSADTDSQFPQLAVYYGQNSYGAANSNQAGWQKNLASYCQVHTYDLSTQIQRDFSRKFRMILSTFSRWHSLPPSSRPLDCLKSTSLMYVFICSPADCAVFESKILLTRACAYRPAAALPMATSQARVLQIANLWPATSKRANPRGKSSL